MPQAYTSEIEEIELDIGDIVDDRKFTVFLFLVVFLFSISIKEFF